MSFLLPLLLALVASCATPASTTTCVQGIYADHTPHGATPAPCDNFKTLEKTP